MLTRALLLAVPLVLAPIASPGHAAGAVPRGVECSFEYQQGSCDVEAEELPDPGQEEAQNQTRATRYRKPPNPTKTRLASIWARRSPAKPITAPGARTRFATFSRPHRSRPSRQTSGRGTRVA